jgi:hypothetical protein
MGAVRSTITIHLLPLNGEGTREQHDTDYSLEGDRIAPGKPRDLDHGVLG